MGRWKNTFWMGFLCLVVVSTSSGADVGDLKIRAEAGDAEAQELLGKSYQSAGRHIEAYEWLQKAANVGRPEAQCHLGNMLLTGRVKIGGGTGPVTANPPQGIAWLKLAAEQNHMVAQRILSECYEQSTGTPKDLTESYKWALLVTEQRASNRGRSDSVALKLSTAQIIEGKRRAAAFLASRNKQDQANNQPVKGLTQQSIPTSASVTMQPEQPQQKGVDQFLLRIVSVVRASTRTMLLLAAAVGVALLGFVVRMIPSKSRRKQVPRNIPRQKIILEKRSAPASNSFQEIDWFQFEKLMELIYSKEGYRVERRGGANPDGGIDLVLERGIDRIAVQCKHWKTQQAGVKVVREFLGAMTAERFHTGIFVITNHVTEEARDLAQKNNIQIVDQFHLELLFKKYDAAFDPEFTVLLNGSEKWCPKCESEMVPRVTKKGSDIGEMFWGCSALPRCRFVLKGGDLKLGDRIQEMETGI
jgi:hypothetical protein